MFYCYILRLSNGCYYIGSSKNLKQRIVEHRAGRVFTTRKLLPIALVYYSAFETKKKALDFERYLKTKSGFAFRNKHLI